ncbi:MAG: biopolymer transporter ExbD [Acidobacteriota bacterium]
MRLRKLSAERHPEDEMPTASMADLAFLLIIFFMLTSVFSEDAGLKVTLAPKEALPEDAAPEPAIAVRIGADRVSVDERILDRDRLVPQLQAHVRPLLMTRPERPVLILGTPDSSYGLFIEVQDALRQVEELLKSEGVLADRMTVSIPSLEEIDLLADVFGKELTGVVR